MLIPGLNSRPNPHPDSGATGTDFLFAFVLEVGNLHLLQPAGVENRIQLEAHVTGADPVPVGRWDFEPQEPLLACGKVNGYGSRSRGFHCREHLTPQPLTRRIIAMKLLFCSDNDQSALGGQLQSRVEDR